MELTLDSNDIKKALEQYVAGQGFDLTNKHVAVALINGRGGNGNRAIVNITETTANSTMKDKPQPSQSISHKVDNLDLDNIPEESIIDPTEEALHGDDESGIDPVKAAAPVEETIPIKGEDTIIPMAEMEDVPGLFTKPSPESHPETETLF